MSVILKDAARSSEGRSQTAVVISAGASERYLNANAFYTSALAVVSLSA